MLNIRQSRFLKITAIVVLLSFLPAQTSWAGRGRRGGNTTGDLILSAIGGASTPLSCLVFGTNPATLLIASGTRYALTKAGCDQHTIMLVTAAVGAASGEAFSGEALLSDTMIKAVVKQVVAAEVTYELSRAEGGKWYAGMAGSMAGYMTGAGMELAGGNMEGTEVTKTAKLEDGKTITYQEKIPGFNDYMKIENLSASAWDVFVRRGLRALIREGLRSASNDSLAYRIYGHEVVSLASGLAGEGAEELGILRETDKYVVTDVIDKNELQQLFQKTGREATGAEIAKYEKEGGAAFVWFDKNERDKNERGLKRTLKDENEKYWTVRYKPRDRNGVDKVAEIKSLAETGHRFMIEQQGTKAAPEERFLVMRKAGGPASLIWDKPEGQSYIWDVSKEQRREQKPFFKSLFEGFWPKRKEFREVTVSYNKVPFSDKIKDVQVGGVQWGYVEQKQPVDLLDKVVQPRVQQQILEESFKPSPELNIFRDNIIKSRPSDGTLMWRQ